MVSPLLLLLCHLQKATEPLYTSHRACHVSWNWSGRLVAGPEYVKSHLRKGGFVRTDRFGKQQERLTQILRGIELKITFPGQSNQGAIDGFGLEGG